MHDKFKKRFQAQRPDSRLRHQIAVEAARRVFAAIGPRDARGYLEAASENDFYVAKRKAAAVLGHRIRPGDLPSDSEVREQVLVLARARRPSDAAEAEPSQPEPATLAPLERMADHVDRFAIYRLRLAPLEVVKQNVRHHPEGDALYHSLQVFELARNARPYDEELLLAALLHDVGKAIDSQDHRASALEALEGTITERTRWLIAHHSEGLALRRGTLDPRTRKTLEASEFFDDLLLLGELDESGRVPGAPVGTIDEALAYIRGLEEEEYLKT